MSHVHIYMPLHLYLLEESEEERKAYVMSYHVYIRTYERFMRRAKLHNSHATHTSTSTSTYA